MIKMPKIIKPDVERIKANQTKANQTQSNQTEPSQTEPNTNAQKNSMYLDHARGGKIKHFLLFSVFYLALVLLLCSIFSFGNPRTQRTQGGIITETPTPFTIVIDAGHGGEDGGASGFIDGKEILEKDLSLSYATMLGEMFTSVGMPAKLTRTEDKLLYKDEENIKGKRKIYDLKNRLLYAKNTENPLFVSIHMNTFPQEKYHGLQTWYRAEDVFSQKLAKQLQTSVVEMLQPENKRVIKPSTGDLYLLDRAEYPAVLVECGFLTNPLECENLTDPLYQKKLTFALFCAVMTHLEETEDV